MKRIHPLFALSAFFCLAGSATAGPKEDIVGGLAINASSPFQWRNPYPGETYLVDTLRLDLRVLDTLAFRLGARAVSREPDEYRFERRAFGWRMYSYCFYSEWFPALKDTTLSTGDGPDSGTLRLRKGRLAGQYGIYHVYGDIFRYPENLDRFLLSAYHQHLFPEYRKDDSRFMALPERSQAGLWLRGALSPSWANAYADDGGPFAGRNTRKDAKPIRWLFDGAFYAVALAGSIGAIANGNTEYLLQKLLILKGVHTAFSFGFLIPSALDLAEANRIRNSGYRIPIELKTKKDW